MSCIRGHKRIDLQLTWKGQLESCVSKGALLPRRQCFCQTATHVKKTTTYCTAAASTVNEERRVKQGWPFQSTAIYNVTAAALPEDFGTWSSYGKFVRKRSTLPSADAKYALFQQFYVLPMRAKTDSSPIVYVTRIIRYTPIKA